MLHDELHYLVIAAIAHLIAVSQAFICHRSFVFRSRDRWLAEFVRFNVALLAPLVAGMCALWFCVEILRMTPLVSQAVVTVSTVALSYLVHRRFTFPVR